MGKPAGPSAVAIRYPCLYVPHVTGMLNLSTLEAVTAGPMPVIPVPIPMGDPGFYGRVFRALWSRGKTFVMCEHDVAPTYQQLEQIATCGHSWCSYNYDDGLYPAGPMFGLCRFDAQTMAEHPHAAEVALVIGKRRDFEAEWWRVDSLVARDLMIRQVQWREHQPDVRHLHHGPPSGPP